MNLEDILKALKSCGIEPEKYGYGHHYGGMQDSYYIKDNKYYHPEQDILNPQKILNSSSYLL